jgi:phospholipid-transporting ATPase
MMFLGTYTTLFDSPLYPWGTLLTLFIMVGISMTKEGFEDNKRHIADAVTNSQKTLRMTRHLDSNDVSFETVEWKDIRVGNIIKVSINDEIPADIILLTSSEPHGNAYVETSNIDGESNLKLKSSARTGHEWEDMKVWRE